MINNKGFSLIELIVVVAIIAIISAIAFPAYQDQVRKSRRTDARTALTTIALAQERFFTINGTYASAASSLDINADLQDGDSADAYYALTLTQSGNTFEVKGKAQNGQENDTNCQVFFVNQLGVQISSSDATATTISASTDSGCW